MFLKNLALLIVFAFPTLGVHWTSPTNKELNINVTDANQLEMLKCAQEKFDIKYKFELQLCKRGRFYSARCGPERLENHSLRFDPITQAYKVTIDRLGDKLEPVSTTYDTLDAAMADVSRIDSLPLNYLWTKPDSGRTSSWIKVRVVASCKEDSYRAFSWIPYLVTLGLVEPGVYSSGWQRFELSE